MRGPVFGVEEMHTGYIHVYVFAVHLLATTTNVTTNNIKVPYKMLYLDISLFKVNIHLSKQCVHTQTTL